jgi:hypothetical protein
MFAAEHLILSRTLRAQIVQKVVWIRRTCTYSVICLINVYDNYLQMMILRTKNESNYSTLNLDLRAT